MDPFTYVFKHTSEILSLMAVLFAFLAWRASKMESLSQRQLALQQSLTGNTDEKTPAFGFKIGDRKCTAAVLSVMMAESRSKISRILNLLGLLRGETRITFVTHSSYSRFEKEDFEETKQKMKGDLIKDVWFGKRNGGLFFVILINSADPSECEATIYETVSKSKQNKQNNSKS